MRPRSAWRETVASFRAAPLRVVAGEIAGVICLIATCWMLLVIGGALS